jgi:DNA polymerase-1
MAIDIETSGLDPYQDRLLSIAVSNGEETWILLDFFGFDTILPHLKNEDIVKVAHNAKFEYVWFKQLGVTVTNWYDTFIAEKVIATDDSLPMSLDQVLGRHVGAYMDKVTRETFEEHPGFAVRPVTNEQVEYMRDDVLYLNQLKEKQEVWVAKMQLERTLQLELDVLPAVAELELNGVNLDIDLWMEQVAEFTRLADEADITMRNIIGETILHVPAKKDGEDIIKEIPTEEINLNSPIQLKTLFSDRFDLKTTTTNAAFLSDVAGNGLAVSFWKWQFPIPVGMEASAFATELLKHRGYRKRIGFDYTKFIHPKTGKVHPSYHQLGARTGRFSCSKPNLQQVPRPVKDEPNIRHVWVADSEDYVIIRADYSQQEPRVMAQLCGDPAMIEACNKEDVYIEFGKHIYGHEIEKGSEERYVSKTFVLAVGFGAGGAKLAATSGKDEKTCLAIKNTIQNTFPIMAQYGGKMYNILSQYGYVETAIGRRRYMNPMFTMAVNTPVQGTAADMFKLSLAKVHNALTELKKSGTIDKNTRVWNLVHDEIEVHCHKDEVSFIMPLVKRLMEEAGQEICPDVLHVAEAEYGYRWDK